MKSKEALEQIMGKYIFYVPARSEGKEHLLNCLNIVAKDLERLEKLEEEIKELKSIIEEQSLKIAKDSKEMSDMDLQIRQLKGEFMPLDCPK
jgi:uncharacterized coiled-coil protein SlyX